MHSSPPEAPGKLTWGLPKIRGSFLGVPIIRIIFGGVYIISPYFGKLPLKLDHARPCCQGLEKNMKSVKGGSGRVKNQWFRPMVFGGGLARFGARRVRTSPGHSCLKDGCTYLKYRMNCKIGRRMYILFALAATRNTDPRPFQGSLGP